MAHYPSREQNAPKTITTVALEDQLNVTSIRELLHYREPMVVIERMPVSLILYFLSVLVVRIKTIMTRCIHYKASNSKINIPITTII